MTDPKRFLDELIAGMDAEARAEFRNSTQALLVRAMDVCGMDEYPPVVGSPDGERAAGGALCECGREYIRHPLDFRVIGFGGRPFLNALCDGRRVKL